MAILPLKIIQAKRCLNSNHHLAHHNTGQYGESVQAGRSTMVLETKVDIYYGAGTSVVTVIALDIARISAPGLLSQGK